MSQSSYLRWRSRAFRDVASITFPFCTGYIRDSASPLTGSDFFNFFLDQLESLQVRSSRNSQHAHFPSICYFFLQVQRACGAYPRVPSVCTAPSLDSALIPGPSGWCQVLGPACARSLVAGWLSVRAPRSRTRSDACPGQAAVCLLSKDDEE